MLTSNVGDSSRTPGAVKHGKKGCKLWQGLDLHPVDSLLQHELCAFTCSAFYFWDALTVATLLRYTLHVISHTALDFITTTS